MIFNVQLLALAAVAAVGAPLALLGVGHASDHADTPDILASPGADITDVFMFPSKDDPSKIVLAMNVHPLIAPGQGKNVSFDPNVLYQFKIANEGTKFEDLVIQAKFEGSGPNQHFTLIGPVEPEMRGAANKIVHRSRKVEGCINQVVTTWDGEKVFCGGREDPFFFDLEQFFNILPDRATPLTGVPVANPNMPQAGSFRAPGQAVDFLSNGCYNVLSIVVELPKRWLKGHGHNHVISMWTTTNVQHGHRYIQMDRLARPAVNEVFATVANGRHEINDIDQPSQDSGELAKDIQGFMAYPAGRSKAIADVVTSVLVPDVMKVDLEGHGAAYLGFETGGATGGTFGGRALTDDVVDISLGVIFGNTVPALGLAPDDGHESPSLTTDNVGSGGKHFQSHFPYLGEPR